MQIKDIESITGISKETLRIWEHRYGFPAPIRNESGDRSYQEDDIIKLIAIKKLLTRGMLPNQVIDLTIYQLREKIEELINQELLSLDQKEFTFIEALVESDGPLMLKIIKKYESEFGLTYLFESFIPRMNLTVGHKWELEQINVYQEHLYTEVVEKYLREVETYLPSPNKKSKLLFTTLEGELHQLGMILINTYCRFLGYDSFIVGASLPIDQIKLACDKIRPDILGISISLNYDNKKADNLLSQLFELPDLPKIVVGGNGALSLNDEKYNIISDIKDFSQYLNNWS